MALLKITFHANTALPGLGAVSPNPIWIIPFQINAVTTPKTEHHFSFCSHFLQELHIIFFSDESVHELLSDTGR